MTVLDALRAGQARLSAVPDPRLDAEYLLAFVLDMPRLNMLVNKQRILTAQEAAAYDALLSRRENREPLQYILGTQSFMGLPFKTDARALIPRNDTEALCEAALSFLKSGQTALDLCTGSGILGITLKKKIPGAAVTASDISADALSLARENAAALHADVRLLQGDLFAPVAGERFDLIEDAIRGGNGTGAGAVRRAGRPGLLPAHRPGSPGAPERGRPAAAGNRRRPVRRGPGAADPRF